MPEDTKEFIDVRRLTSFSHVLEELSRIYDAGFYADLTCVGPQPKGFAGAGISLEHYYELHVFKWTKG